MRRNKSLWRIGLVIATSLFLSITGCTWTDDIWGEPPEKQTSESAAQMEPEPHQKDEVSGVLKDSGPIHRDLRRFKKGLPLHSHLKDCFHRVWIELRMEIGLNGLK